MTKYEIEIFWSELMNSKGKKSIRDALDKASSMYPYEVIGKPETYPSTIPDGRTLLIICHSF